MSVVYNLESKVIDKLGRAKKTEHVGVFDTMEKVEEAKRRILESNPGVIFEVYFCEHLFSKL